MTDQKPKPIIDQLRDSRDLILKEIEAAQEKVTTLKAELKRLDTCIKQWQPKEDTK